MDITNILSAHASSMLPKGVVKFHFFAKKPSKKSAAAPIQYVVSAQVYVPWMMHVITIGVSSSRVAVKQFGIAFFIHQYGNAFCGLYQEPVRPFCFFGIVESAGLSPQLSHIAK